jgi:hypothetical protein
LSFEMPASKTLDVALEFLPGGKCAARGLASDKQRAHTASPRRAHSSAGGQQEGVREQGAGEGSGRVAKARGRVAKMKAQLHGLFKTAAENVLQYRLASCV